jgi:hypothetical protein
MNGFKFINQETYMHVVSVDYGMARTDDMLWNDSEDGDVRSECEEDDNIYCKDGVSDTD